MISLAEDVPWEALEEALQRQFTGWNLSHADLRARSVVSNLRRSGWRIPLPAGSEPPKMGTPLRPEVVKRNIQMCREAIRATKVTDET